MQTSMSPRAVSAVLLATLLALAPALAEARRGGGGGGRGGGGGGGGVRSSGMSSISRGGGGGMRSGGMDAGGRGGGRQSAGGYGGGDRAGSGRASAGQLPAGGNRGNGSRNEINGGGNRVNGGGNRVNNGNINTGDRNTNINVDNDNGWGDWSDRPYYPVAGAIAVGAIAGATAAAVYGSTYYALPSGCSPYPYGGYSYYHCGSVYYETRYVGDKVTYVVVERPG
jgi:hypothetical protein